MDDWLTKESGCQKCSQSLFKHMEESTLFRVKQPYCSTVHVRTAEVQSQHEAEVESARDIWPNIVCK